MHAASTCAFVQPRAIASAFWSPRRVAVLAKELKLAVGARAAEHGREQLLEVARPAVQRLRHRHLRPGASDARLQLGRRGDVLAAPAAAARAPGAARVPSPPISENSSVLGAAAAAAPARAAACASAASSAARAAAAFAARGPGRLLPRAARSPHAPARALRRDFLVCVLACGVGAIVAARKQMGNCRRSSNMAGREINVWIRGGPPRGRRPIATAANGNATPSAAGAADPSTSARAPTCGRGAPPRPAAAASAAAGAAKAAARRRRHSAATAAAAAVAAAAAPPSQQSSHAAWLGSGSGRRQ